MAGNITVVTRMRAKSDGEAGKVERAASALVALTRKEPGAVLCDLYRNAADGAYFLLQEIWTGQDAIGKHMATAHFKTFMGNAPTALVSPGPGIKGLFEVTIATPFDPGHPPTSSPVTVATRFKAREGSGSAAAGLARKLAETTHAEQGSLGYDLYRHVEQPVCFFLFERWRNFAAIQQHMATPQFKAFMGDVPALLTRPAANVEGPFEVLICDPYVASRVRA